MVKQMLYIDFVKHLLLRNGDNARNTKKWCLENAGYAILGYWDALNQKSIERQNSTHLALLKHQNSKTALYKLPKNHWVVTVSLDHPVSSDSDTKYFLSHDSNVMSYHQWKTFQVVVTDDVYPPTRLCWCNYTRGCQAVVTWCNVQHAGSVNLIDIPIVGRWQS